MTRNLRLALLSAILAMVFSPAKADVVLNETNFPNATFRSYIATLTKVAEGGTLTDEKLASIKTIECQNKSGITDLTGIEHFTALTTLNCYSCKLTALDVSKNTALTSLSCYSNSGLTELDLTNNLALTSLQCNSCGLTALDVSKNTALTSLYCYSNSGITELDVTKNLALTSLQCYSCGLTELNVNNNTALTDLKFGNTGFERIYMENITELTSLTCLQTNLKTLDLTKNTNLTYLTCSSNSALASIDVSNNPSLKYFCCRGNAILPELDLSSCTALQTLECFENPLLANLDLSNNPSLTEMKCYKNAILPELDLRSCTKLRTLECYSNALTELTLPSTSTLQTVTCYGNKLTEINTTNNPGLKTFSCGNNPLNGLNLEYNTVLNVLLCNNCGLDELDLKTNTALTSLECANNNLSELDLKTNTALTGLSCQKNSGITALDLSNNTALNYISCYSCSISSLILPETTTVTKIYCFSNSLPSLDASTYTNLTHLYCQSNKISELNLDNNMKLQYMACYDNQLTSLNLSSHTGMKNIWRGSWDITVIDTQKLSRELRAFSDGKTIAIPVPAGINYEQISDFKIGGKATEVTSSTIQTIDGQDYIVVAADVAADTDLFGKTVTYDYLTGIGSANMANSYYKLTVTINISAFCMYVNPKAENGDKYYGTLFVDRPVTVPEGATCYYAHSIDAESEQLNMTKIQGGIIPASTPVYVEAETRSGMFAFNETSEAATDAIGTNCLKGTLKGITVPSMSVLTLGHDRSSNLLGFWNYRGTSIPAHRCYVAAETLEALGTEAKGLTLHFEDGTATDIPSIVPSAETTKEVIHDLQGRRVATPKKGIYIVNGKKIVIK